MPVSEQAYLKVALEDPGQWELHCGHLRRKPGIAAEHNEVAFELGFRLGQQLDRSQYHVRVSMGHVRRSAESYYIPEAHTMSRLTFELPDHLVARLGSPEQVAATAKKAFVMELLRESEIGLSRAAELLGITRAELLELMGEHQVAAGPATVEDVDREVEAARRATQ